MKQCSLDEFLDGIRNWLSADYIRKAGINAEGDFVLDFTDGVRNVYRIDDCTAGQLDLIIGDLKREGIAVEE